MAAVDGLVILDVSTQLIELLFWWQVIWVCILCRKKQELVVKTGKWILPSGAPMQQQQGGSGSGGASHLMINDKRPRLERAVSYERDNSGGGGVRPGVSSMSSSCAYGTPSSGAPTHAPLQRSGSLQSHGPSSWRPLPSDVNPLASRGKSSPSAYWICPFFSDADLFLPPGGPPFFFFFDSSYHLH